MCEVQNRDKHYLNLNLGKFMTQPNVYLTQYVYNLETPHSVWYVICSSCSVLTFRKAKSQEGLSKIIELAIESLRNSTQYEIMPSPRLSTAWHGPFHPNSMDGTSSVHDTVHKGENSCVVWLY